MKAQEILDEVARQLNDVGGVTWTQVSLFDYINSAQEVIASFRPDASSSITTMKMVAGTKQTLPTTALRLLEVIRNMGSAGTTPGRVIRAADHESISLFNSAWHSQGQVVEVKNFAYSEKNPDTFYVDPPSDGTEFIEISVSVAPTEVNDGLDDLTLKDIYKPHVIQWCMFRAYSIEVDSASSQNRAAAHEKSFYQLMGKKFERDIMFSPSVEVQEAQGGG